MKSNIIILIACLLPFAAGCADGDENLPGTSVSDSSSSQNLTVSSCQSRCTAKTEACGVAASAGAETCGSLCSPLSITETQARCLESEACNVLLAAFQSGSTVCGIGAPAECGDGRCDSGETNASCPSDCEAVSGGAVGDPCTCNNPTLQCMSSSSGCNGGLWCFVNSDTKTSGFCTKECETEGQQCPSGTTCKSYTAYSDGKTAWRCK